MPATYNGPVTIGGTVPGLNDAFLEVGTALEILRDEVFLHLPCFLEAIAAMADVRIAAVVDFEAQLKAAVAIQAQLGISITDPALYLQLLLTGLAQLTINIPALVPQIALSAQISAAASIEAQFAAKIALVDAKIKIVLDLLNACYLALTAIAVAAFAAIEKFHRFQGYLATAGAYSFTYTGTLGGLGAALDAVTPAIGQPVGEPIVATIQVVRTVTSSAIAAHAAVYL